MRTSIHRRCLGSLSFDPRRLRSSLAVGLIGALCMSTFSVAGRAQNSNKTSSPGVVKPDTYTDKSGSLPGFCGTGCKAATIAAGAGAAVLIVALVVHHHHMQEKAKKARLDADPVHFTDYIPGQPIRLTVPLTNDSASAVTVEEIVVTDDSNALRLNAGNQPFTLAAGAYYQIPVTLSTSSSAGKARIRILARSEDAAGAGGAENVKSVEVSWGHGRSGLHKLIP
jgi:hypothetical protein